MSTKCGLRASDSLDALNFLLKEKLKLYEKIGSPVNMDIRYSIITRNDAYYVAKLAECKTLFDFCRKEDAEKFLNDYKEQFEIVKCLYE